MGRNFPFSFAMAFVFALALCLLANSPAQAFMLKLSPDELAQKANCVVIGSVLESTISWNDDHTYIYTKVVFNVEESLKGEDKSGKISIMIPGGQVGDKGLTVSDVAHFEPGERAVLFLEQLSQAQLSEMRISQLQGEVSTFQVCGGFQGKLQIEDNMVGNVAVSEFNSQLKESLALGKEMIITSDTANQGTRVIIQNYSYGGVKWPGAYPTVTYRVNATVDQISAMQAAANTWNASGANFSFSYGGTHSTTAYSDPPNDVNEILFRNNGSDASIARTIIWSMGSTVVECDQEFNTYYSYSWNAADTCPSGYYDLQSICLHEMGHWFMLNDLYSLDDSDKVMYGFGNTGTTRRVLTADDVAGIRAIYGTSSTNSVNIPLNSGWNLVSLPLRPANTDIQVVLAGLPAGSVQYVWCYSGGAWQTYSPPAPATLTAMEEGKAYWVSMSAPATLVVSGIAPAHSYSLPVGWNMLGFTSSEAKSPAVYLANIAGKYDILYGYENGSWTMPALLNPGGGYWIHMTQPGTVQ